MILENVKSVITTEDTIYIGQFPINAADNICTLSLIMGRPSTHIFGQQAPLFTQPNVQIRVRSKYYNDGYERCVAIAATLDGLNKQDFVEGPQILNMALESDIVSLGKDEQHRSEFLMIYRLICQDYNNPPPEQ